MAAPDPVIDSGLRTATPEVASRLLGTSPATPEENAAFSLRGVLISFGLLLALTAVKIAWFEYFEPEPFLLYFSAIVVGAWYGGWALGAAVTVAAALFSVVFLVVPTHTFDIAQTGDLARFALFLLEGSAITALTSRLRAQRSAAAAAARAAELSLAKLESVLSAVDDGITVQDQGGKLIFANRPAAELTGFPSPRAMLGASRDEIVSRFELFDADGAPFDRADLPGQRVLRGEAAPPERLLRFRVRETGEEHWALVRARAVLLDGAAAPFAVNAFHDLTQLRKHELELRMNQEWFATALRSIGDAVIATDDEGRVTFMNAVATQLTGWSDSEAKGLTLTSVVKVVNEDTRAPAENPVARVLRDRKAVGMAEHTLLIARDGHELSVDDSAAPILAPSGEMVGAVLVFRDVSKKREQEREVQQASRAKDEFLAMLGHELRNPLAPILTALELMKLRAPETFQRERAIVERQVKHVVRLVDDLLDVSRITSGKVELARERVDLADTVAKGLELAGPLIESRQHQVTTAVPVGSYVLGDPVRLAQVVSNLLTNAAKYTAAQGMIEVTAAVSGPSIVLRVRDNGIGIEPELLPRLFDLFVQGGQALDRAKGGLGLGLSIVRSVVELHGGRVTAQSAGRGQGSTFEVTLPAAMRESQAPRPIEAPLRAAALGSGARVLVVDDNLDALELLAETLRLVGHEAHTAQDAAAALQVAQAVQPAIALLDIGLPVMDGYELARRLRAMPGLQDIKLAALTGYGQASDKQRAREAGFDEHLVKPISITAVQSAVARLLTP